MKIVTYVVPAQHMMMKHIQLLLVKIVSHAMKDFDPFIKHQIVLMNLI